MYKSQNTICAISTPVGEGGISIIRLSGKNTFSIMKPIFLGKGNMDDYLGYTLHHGQIVDPKFGEIDDVIIGVFRSPNSYTGEDLIEINSHGGKLITKKIIDLLTSLGARIAEPGEFTKRAFLNGKIDLTQAEAIADMISAKSDMALKFSLKSLNGEYGNHIADCHKELIELCGLIELELDFVEDDIQFLKREDLLKKINSLILKIDIMIQSFKFGKIFRDGVKTVLVGKPNVGKSTIMNGLLMSDRAIVSEIPGTTRDFIEDTFTYKGLLFRLVDTAGLRVTDDFIEKEGMERTKKQIKEADVVVYIFDLMQEYEISDIEFYKTYITDSLKSDQKVMILFNKCDLFDNNLVDVFNEGKLGLNFDKNNLIKLSATNKDDIEKLRDKFVDLVSDYSSSMEDNRIVTNVRHRDSLKETRVSLMKSIEAISLNEGNEFIAVHFKKALTALGEITGLVTTDEILNNIFSKFCIGK
jgi:tRNA modification GTPase